MTVRVAAGVANHCRCFRTEVWRKEYSPRVGARNDAIDVRLITGK